MEYGLGKLEEMSRMEYGAANKDELVNIETVHIDPDLPPAERLLNYLEQIKNPYCFRCGDTAVRISFAADGDNLQRWRQSAKYPEKALCKRKRRLIFSCNYGIMMLWL